MCNSNSLFFCIYHELHQTTPSRQSRDPGSARSIEAAINHLISYLSCPKFHVNTRVQVGDVLRDLQPFQGMNDFESERAAKAARFRQLAEKHANIATGRHFAARERLEMIPLGQPILVGHRRNTIGETLSASTSISLRRRNITIKPNTFAGERPPPSPT
jgi:hypothetical protein